MAMTHIYPNQAREAGGQIAPPPAPPRPVPGALEALAENLNGTEKLVSQLYERLDPVLEQICQPPDAKTLERDEEHGLAGQLGAMATKLSRSNLALAKILERLTL